MSEHYQSLVAVDVPEVEASSLGDRAAAWLVARGIVVPELTKCVLSDDGVGHRPGPSRALTTHDDSPIAPYNHGLQTCGLEVVLGRSVAVGWPALATCPRCAFTDPIEDDDENPTEHWERIVTRLGEWYEGGPDAVECPSCMLPVRLNDWQPDFLATWAVGHLVLTFWNWPLLAKGFIADFSQALGGQRLRHTAFQL